MIVHNEYEFDSNNNVELVEYDHERPSRYLVAGKIKGKVFGIDHAATLDQARTEYYAILRIIRQIN